VQDKIEGAPLPVLEVVLDAGEAIFSETGEVSWMSAGIDMHTGGGGGGGGHGFGSALRRLAGGSTLLLTTFSGPGLVAFASKLPGSILPVDLGGGVEYLVHRHGFLAGTPGVQLSVGFQQSFRGGIFGGEGFVLQRVAGEGRAWIELSGHVTSYTLEPGRALWVHPGHVGLFEASVSFQVQKLPGIANRYLGHDGFHVVALTGPGRVWLQSMPVAMLAGAIEPYLPEPDGHGG
jgi:uncharacterized protein (AIM24 family)